MLVELLPALVIPAIVGLFILLKHRHNRYARMLGWFTFKPVITTPFWLALIAIPPLGVLPGATLTIGNRKLTFTFKTQVEKRMSTASASSRGKVERVEPDPPIPQYTMVDAAPLSEKKSTLKIVIEGASDESSIGQVIQVETFPYLLGRLHPNLGNAIEVSRKHAEITFDQNAQAYYITDLSSKNGVTVNSTLIQPNTPTILASGFRVGLGNILVLRFEF